MLYEIDVFGFVAGYMSKDWHIMSEDDIRADRRLARNLYEAKYQLWKRHNISELIEGYKRDNHSEGNFERFCRKTFDEI